MIKYFQTTSIIIQRPHGAIALRWCPLGRHQEAFRGMAESKPWREVRGPLVLSLCITAVVWLLLFAVVIIDPDSRQTLESLRHGQSDAASHSSPVQSSLQAFHMHIAMQHRSESCTEVLNYLCSGETGVSGHICNKFCGLHGAMHAFLTPFLCIAGAGARPCCAGAATKHGHYRRAHDGLQA